MEGVLSTVARLISPALARRFLLAGLLLAPFAPHVRLPLRAAVPAAVLTAGILVQPLLAEARGFGGGRSFGFRGSRSFGGFGRSRSFSRRSSFGRGYGRRGIGMGLGLGMGLGMLGGMGFGGMGYGLFGLGRMLLFPLIMFFILRMMSRR